MNRWGIFAIALAVRGVVASLFFGSYDVVASMRDAARLFEGSPASEIGVPYLPGVQLLIRTAGVLAFHTDVPIAFVFKSFGCLFDAVIAAAIGDVRGRRAGLLYALAPVPLLVFAIHGQWDSIALALFIGALLLLRRDGARAAAGAGALYVLSIVAKPITVPLAVFLVERRRIAPLLGGAAATAGAYLVMLWLAGEPLDTRMLERIAHYARGGVQHFGLPVGLGVTQNRIAMLAVLLVLVPLYATRRLGREDAVAVAYALILGTMGLGAQYLSWLVPFLLLRGHERFAALYGALAATFLVVANASTGYDGLDHAARVAFAPLRGAAWLAPALTFEGVKSFVRIAIGDLVLPLACIGFAAVTLRQRWRMRDEAVVSTASLAPLGVAAAVVAVLALAAFALPAPGGRAFARIARDEPAAVYTLTAALGSTTGAVWHLEEPATPRLVDAVSIGYAWIIAWSIAAAARGGGGGDRPRRESPRGRRCAAAGRATPPRAADT